jgi:MFS family permease
MAENNAQLREPVVLFLLGLVATLGTVLSLAAIGGGAEIVRRNAIFELRLGGGLVLGGVLLAGVASSLPASSSVWRWRRFRFLNLKREILLLAAAILGVVGLAVAGYGVTKRKPGRPSVSVSLSRGPQPSIRITVKAGGLKADEDLNLFAAEFTNRFGDGPPDTLIRESFGPDPSGNVVLESQAPLLRGRMFQSIVIRAWTGRINQEGRCFFERGSTKNLRPAGCVILVLVPRPLSKTRGGAHQRPPKKWGRAASRTPS